MPGQYPKRSYGQFPPRPFPSVIHESSCHSTLYEKLSVGRKGKGRPNMSDGDIDARWRMGGQLHTPVALPSIKSPGTHYRAGLMDPRAGLDGYGENIFTRTGLRAPDGQARSESLYRLRYPSPCLQVALLSSPSNLSGTFSSSLCAHSGLQRVALDQCKCLDVMTGDRKREFVPGNFRGKLCSKTHSCVI
jgi:hypothetical protein